MHDADEQLPYNRRSARDFGDAYNIFHDCVDELLIRRRIAPSDLLAALDVVRHRLLEIVLNAIKEEE